MTAKTGYRIPFHILTPILTVIFKQIRRNMWEFHLQPVPEKIIGNACIPGSA
jgi:hypothetical protein